MATKERYQKILTYKIKKEKELIKAWRKYNISDLKIQRMEAKQAKHEAEKVVIDAS